MGNSDESFPYKTCYTFLSYCLLRYFFSLIDFRSFILVETKSLALPGGIPQLAGNSFCKT